MDETLVPAFVGRESELAALGAALEATVRGGGRAVIVGGEAGIGKTRLLGQFAGIARSQGSIVLSGACIEISGRELPFAPLSGAMRALVRSVEPGRLADLLGPGRHALGVLVSELAGRATAPAVAVDEDHRAQARFFETIVNVFSRMGRSRPVVFMVEDVQWADQDTRDLLAYLVDALPVSPIMAVLSVRTGDHRPDPRLAHLVAEFEREPWVQRIDLAPFNRDELRRLIEIDGRAEAGEGVLDALVMRTGGNPFYAVHLLANPSLLAGGPIPAAVRDVLTARLGELTPDARKVVLAVAASGGGIDEAGLEVALAAVGWTGARDAGVPEAVDAGVLAFDVDSEGEPYSVRHPLLGELAYSQILPGDRVRLHLAIAEHLLALRAAGRVVAAASIAFHLDRAHDARAVPMLIEAGRHAEAAFAFDQAQRHYERALERWETLGDPRLEGDVDRVWLLQRAGDCAVATGAYDRAVEFGREAIERQGAKGEQTAAARARLAGLHQRLRWYLWELGDRAAAAAAVQDGLREASRSPASPVRARLLAEAAGLRLQAGDLPAAAELADDALLAARAAGGVAEAALAGGVLGWCRAVQGDVEEGLATFAEALHLADAIGGPEGMVVGRANLAALYDRLGRPDQALDAAVDGFAVAERLGFRRTYGGELLAWAARALLDLGRWSEAATRMTQALEISRTGRSAVMIHLTGARLDAYRGDISAARAHLDRARQIDTARGQPGFTVETIAADAELALVTGDRATIRALVLAAEQHHAPDRPIKPELARVAAIGLRAEADEAEEVRLRRAAGQEATAVARAERIHWIVSAAARRQPASVAAADPRIAAYVVLCQAEVNRAIGSGSPNDWDPVVAAFEGIGRPYPVAYARYRRAAALLREGRPKADAAMELIPASHAARTMGAAPLLAQIELIARHARIDLDGRVTHDPARCPDRADHRRHELGLTEREYEVLRLVSAGWSNQEIAATLFITRKTASVHVSNILGKLGVRNRVEAAAIGQRLGIDPDAVSPPIGAEEPPSPT